MKASQFEIIAAILTGIGKFIFMDWLQWKLPYILTIIVGWLVYISYRYKQNPRILASWGLHTQHFGSSFKGLFPLFLMVLGVFFVLGMILGSNIISWHIIPILLVYPIWGIIQQFLVVGLTARNLSQTALPASMVILITALLFSVVHYPHFLLIIGTFFLAVAYTILYLRRGENLLVLGIYHGWLGAFFYFIVLGRDPLIEILGI